MLQALTHKSLNVYQATRKLVCEVYKVSNLLPVQEKFNLTSQIQRAGLSVKLNLAEGCGRKSALERARFFEMSRSSIVEIDAAIETAIDLNYILSEQTESFSQYAGQCFAMLSKLIQSTTPK